MVESLEFSDGEDRTEVGTIKGKLYESDFKFSTEKKEL